MSMLLLFLLVPAVHTIVTPSSRVQGFNGTGSKGFNGTGSKVSNGTGSKGTNARPMTLPGDVISQMKTCGADSVVLLYDNDHPEVETTLRQLSGSQVLVFNLGHAGHNETREVLYDFYVTRNQTFFVLQVRWPHLVMASADDVFHQHHRSQAAIMPHKATWLILVYDATQMDRLVVQQTTSPMDHVTIIHINPDALPTNTPDPPINTPDTSMNNPDPPIIIPNLPMSTSDPLGSSPEIVMDTFVWNSSYSEIRTKRLQRVQVSDTPSNECVIFPNLKLGMNGRHLQAAIKLYMSRSYIDIKNNPQGELVVSGFRKKLLEALSTNLNFTFSFIELRNSSQNTLEALQENRDWDLSMLLWHNTMVDQRVDISSPVHYEVIRGMYRRPSDHLTFENMSTTLLFPFPTQLLIFIPASILFTALVWTFVASVNRPEHETPARSSPTKTETNSRPEPTQGGKGTSALKRVIKSRFPQFMSMSWAVSTAFVNQGHIPTTGRMSARIITWSFWITVVIFYASYTAEITSKRVKHTKPAPFNTFEQMLANGEFRWGTLRDGDTIRDTFNKSNNVILKKLTLGMIYLNDVGDLDMRRQELIDKINQGGFVFIYFETLISNLLQEGDFVLMEESLMTMNRGLCVPKGSQFNELLSRAILRIHDSGLNEHLLKKFDLSVYSGAIHARGNPGRTGSSKPVHVIDIVSLLCLVSFMVLFACVILVSELLVALCPLLLYLKRLIPNAHLHGLY